MSKSESVYVLKNLSFPNLLKIGRTTRDIKHRVNELSKQTGVPTPFVAVMKIRTENSNDLEKLIHNHLNEIRIPDKELFEISEEELYSKLTDDLNLTVKKITETSDSEDIDIECGNSSDDKSKNKGNGCTVCSGKCGEILEPIFEKEYKLLQKTASDFLELCKKMESRGSNEYYTVKYSPMAKDDDRKKYREFICEDKNNRYMSDEGFKYCKVPSLANNLYDYDFNDNWFDDKELHYELKVFRNDFNIFIARKISELEDAIYSGDQQLKDDDSYTKTAMFKGDKKHWNADLKELSKKLDKMSDQQRKWCQ